MRQLRIARGRLTRAIGDAYRALAKEDCDALFGVPDSPNTPRSILAALEYGTSAYGSIALGPIEQRPGTVTSATTAPTYTKVDIGDGATQLQVLGVKIVVEWSVGVFKSGSDVDRAAIIIHELGHAFNQILGLGGSQIKNDNDSIPNHVRVSEANDALVKEKCF